MSVPFRIIDGYNLMHEAGLARETYGPGDLGRIRLRLLAMLSQRLNEEERTRCTVVFDAIDAPPKLTRRFKHQQMLVEFAEPGHEADEVIEALIRDHSSPRNLIVVSSDHRLQTAVHRRRGTSIDSDVFLKQLQASRRTIESKPSIGSAKPGGAEDIDFWLSEFEQVNPSQVHAELKAESNEPQDKWGDHLNDLQRELDELNQSADWIDPPPPGTRPPKNRKQK